MDDPKSTPSIEELLRLVESGDEGAFGRLVDAIYPELKRLAHYQLMTERANHTLNATAIVHEAYERLASNKGQWNDEKHFLRAAATVMRHVLVDYARKRNADKRGNGIAAVTLEEQLHSSNDDSLAVLTLDDAIKDIAKIDPRLEQIIECRYFAGLSVKETALALDTSVRTVEREWQRAKGYLLTAMDVHNN